jgi:singapore isolate B (sub-type 7) whole genome shotgun sequence assembly, scaffold_15
LRSKDKPKAVCCINTSLASLGSIYLITGVVLFLMFRQDPRHVQEAILLNLPGNSLAYYAVAITMVLTLLGSFPLLLLPCFEILETNISERSWWC